MKSHQHNNVNNDPHVNTEIVTILTLDDVLATLTVDDIFEMMLQRLSPKALQDLLRYYADKLDELI